MVNETHTMQAVKHKKRRVKGTLKWNAGSKARELK